MDHLPEEEEGVLNDQDVAPKEIMEATSVEKSVVEGENGQELKPTKFNFFDTARYRAKYLIGSKSNGYSTVQADNDIKNAENDGNKQEISFYDLSQSFQREIIKQNLYIYCKNSWNTDRPLVDDGSYLNKFRMAAQRIAENPWFDRLVLVTIFLSTVFFAMSDYNNVDDQNNLVADGSIRNTIVIRGEIVFTYIFLFEFFIKATALGLWGRSSYFGDPWNWIDFMVVVFAMISLYSNIDGVTVFKTFRVLRPLRTIKSSPELASVVSLLLESFVSTRDIFTVLIFMFIVFGIAGLQIFVGPYMHTRCRLTPFPVNNSWSLGLDPEPYRCLMVS